MIRKKKKYTVIFILIALYILGLMIGFAVILGIPYSRHKSSLIRIAEHEAKIYAKEGVISSLDNFGMSFLVYDTKGNCKDSILSGVPDMSYNFNAGKHMPKIYKEGNFYQFELVSTKDSTHTERNPAIVVGTAIKRDDKVIGALFLIRDFEDLFPTLIGYFCVWTIIFSLICLCYYILEKKNGQIEQMQRMNFTNVSHELKSPITSIKALMETLIDGYASDEEKRFRYYDMILSETNRLETTVQDILDLSKLQNSKTIFCKQIVSVSELFIQICERFFVISSDIDIQFHQPSIDMNTLPKLNTNPDRVSKLLDILLHNAIKFTTENGEIWFEIAIEKEKLIVSIRDSGCGISKDDLPHIFERFYKVDASHNSQGSGLGLSIAKEIIDGLNEKIWVESKPGIGTTFFFTLSIK